MTIKMYSVTQVLSPWANEHFQQQGISNKKLANAAAKGSLVHQFCEAYALCLPLPVLPDIYKGYGESFKLWFDKYVKKVIWVEKELRDEELGFLGHPDLLCEVDFGKGPVLALPDLKTPVQYSAFWQVQLSAYLHLVRKAFWNPEWVGSIQVDINGGFPKPHKHVYAERDLAIFISALQVRRYLG